MSGELQPWLRSQSVTQAGIKAIISEMRGASAAFRFHDLRTTLTALLDGLRRRTVRIDDPRHCKAAFDALRRPRLFDEMLELAETLLATDHQHAVIRHQQAQALIDSGLPASSFDVLAKLSGQSGLSARDKSEALGLIGRAHKQIYIDQRRRGVPAKMVEQEIVRAIDHYSQALEKYAGDDCWPDINIVALLALAERDRLLPTGDTSRPTIAEQIIERLAPTADESGKNNPWIFATLGEAHIALGRWEEAQHWFDQYATAADVDAFALAGTARQLKELWGAGHGSRPVDQILSTIERRAMLLPNGRIELTSQDVSNIKVGDAALDEDDALQTESVIGADERMKLSWLKKGIRRSDSIVRIRDAYRDVPVGTGFFVDGLDFDSVDHARAHVLTNEHVVSGIQLRDIEIIVEDDEDRPYRCERIAWSSPKQELDAALLVLRAEKRTATPLVLCCDDDRVRNRLDEYGDGPRPRCIVIGFPEEGEAKISLSRTELTGLGFKHRDKTDHIFLRYQTATEPGNSGSPVFDEAWQVIGLHRAGMKEGRAANGKAVFEPVPRLNGSDGKEEANEGVAMKSIVAAAKRHLGRTQATAAAAGSAPVAQIGSSREMARPERISIGELNRRLSAGLDTEAAPYLQVDGGRLVPDPNLVIGAEKPEPGLEESPESAERVSFYDLIVERANGRMAAARDAQFEINRRAFPERPVLLAMGDSWFQFPQGTWASKAAQTAGIFSWNMIDVLEHLLGEYNIKSISKAGATLEELMGLNDIVRAVEAVMPKAILLSGSGNDLLGDGKLKIYVTDHQPGKEAAAHLRANLSARLLTLHTHYVEVVSDLKRAAPGVPILCHGYAYACPKPGEGKWLHDPLFQKGIKDERLQKAIVRAIIDRFNAEVIAKLATEFPGTVHHVQTVDLVDQTPSGWSDELHPTRDGFGYVANEFRRELRRVLRRRR